MLSNDAEYLRRALDAFGVALSEYNPEQTPNQWIRSQKNLGFVLLEFGGMNRDVTYLEQAAEVFRAVLSFEKKILIDSTGTQDLLKRSSGLQNCEQPALANASK